jgi:hypothetical protein
MSDAQEQYREVFRNLAELTRQSARANLDAVASSDAIAVGLADTPGGPYPEWDELALASLEEQAACIAKAAAMARLIEAIDRARNVALALRRARGAPTTRLPN